MPGEAASSGVDEAVGRFKARFDRKCRWKHASVLSLKAITGG